MHAVYAICAMRAAHATQCVQRARARAEWGSESRAISGRGAAQGGVGSETSSRPPRSPSCGQGGALRSLGRRAPGEAPGGGGRLGRDDVRVAAPAREGGGDGPPRTSGFGSSGVIRSAPMCAAVASAHSVGFAATRRRIVLVLTSGGAEEARGVEGGGGRRGGVSRHGWGRGEAQNAATGSGVGVIAPWNARPQLDIIATLVADTWACFSPLLWSAPAGSTHGQHPCARR